MEIKTCIDLYKYVDQLVKEQASNKRNLEDYLLALLKQVQAVQDKQPSYQDIANFLRDSYTGEIAEYSKDWKDLPTWLTEPNTDAHRQEIETYEYLERKLKIYIADLHYIRTSIWHALFSSSSVDGIKGRGGKIIWQRTDVSRFLVMGVATLENDDDGEPASWNLLSYILTDGVFSE